MKLVWPRGTPAFKRPPPALLTALITTSEQNGIWTLQAGIFPENTASVALHKGLGFREVGFREKIGKMGDRWRDTVLLEKRSIISIFP